MVSRLAGLTLCLAVLATAAPADAKTVRWGSSLKPAADRMVPGVFHADAEFWNTSLGSSTASGVQRTVKAPVSGRILNVKIKAGDDAAGVFLRFTVLKPLSGGRFQVMTTSTPHLLMPAHSPGIHTFDFSKLKFKMPINKGYYLGIATPGGEPNQMLWYGGASGAGVDSFTSHGATQNPGFVWNGTPHSGTELLMQVTELKGKPYHFHLP